MNDERIVNYMKARNGQAQMTATAIAVQLFALAVFFAMYALSVSGLFYSQSADTGKIITIAVAVAVSVFLCVVNVLGVIRSDKVYITRPDRISLRDGEEVIRLAYQTARPVLINKITYSLVIMTASGLVYIILLIAMKDAALAGIYGRIICSIILALVTLIAYPCIDRIACYRALLNETHDLYYDIKPNKAILFISSIAIPLSICLWYILRYYGSNQKIAWIVFPVAALIGIAVSFLVNWSRDSVIC